MKEPSYGHVYMKIQKQKEIYVLIESGTLKLELLEKILAKQGYLHHKIIPGL